MIIKISIVSFIVLLLLVFSNGCEDADFITGYQGDRELKEGEEVPFLLGQNYPNPFNHTTTIPFRVAINLDLKLTVYSDEWQPVKVLLEQPTNPGSHTLQFDAEDLPSGDYYYTLEGGDYTQIRKMKLVK
jgi:hypothetical protein